MSLLRKSCVAVVPPEDTIAKRKFFIATTDEEIVPLYDSKGEQISQQVRHVTKREVISDDVIGHKGVKSELFSLKNQIESGVSLTPFTGSFIRHDLSQSHHLGDEAISAVERVLSDKDNFKQDNNE